MKQRSNAMIKDIIYMELVLNTYRNMQEAEMPWTPQYVEQGAGHLVRRYMPDVIDDPDTQAELATLVAEGVWKLRTLAEYFESVLESEGYEVASSIIDQRTEENGGEDQSGRKDSASRKLISFFGSRRRG
jgi:hypothetical protein